MYNRRALIGGALHGTQTGCHTSRQSRSTYSLGGVIKNDFTGIAQFGQRIHPGSGDTHKTLTLLYVQLLPPFQICRGGCYQQAHNTHGSSRFHVELYLE